MSYTNSLVDQALYLLSLTETSEALNDIHTAYRYECSLFEVMSRMSEDELSAYREKCKKLYENTDDEFHQLA